MKRLIPLVLALLLFLPCVSLAAGWFGGGVRGLQVAPWLGYGDGSDGAGPASGAITGQIKMYSSWTCTGAVTFSAGLFVMSKGPVVLSTGCSIKRTTGNAGVGDYGGAGGSGGSGSSGLNSAAGSAVTYWGSSLDAGGLASANSAGNAPTALSAALIRGMWLYGPPPLDVWIGTFTGGGAGSAGGNTGGAAGNGGFPFILSAPSISIASGVIIDTSGFPGVATTANSKGGGGGGGGAPIILGAASLTDAGGIFKYGAGPGGAITQPSIQATGGGCDSGTNGCGINAAFTVTGLTTGGLDASKITIANAGTGYQTVPDCTVNAGGSSLTGTPACHFTINPATHAIASVVIDTPGTGGTLTTYTSTFIGAYGANAFMKEVAYQ